jgi:hypothetical protein
MTSQGPWIATKKLFEKNGFSKLEKRGRFELMVKKIKDDSPDPSLVDWERKLSAYAGWHLIYADQCPWHEKGIRVIENAAKEKGIKINLKKIETAEEAKNSPSGFGVFALVKDGELLEDHYISKRRFETIADSFIK